MRPQKVHAMRPQIVRWQRLVAGGLCAAAFGCSSAKFALQSSPKLPDQITTSTPGTLDAPVGDELRHPANVHVAYARWQEQQRQLPQARDSYRQALNHDPRSVEALLGLSRLDRLAGRTTEAERHLAQAERLRPGDPLVAAAWGEHYAAAGRYGEAIEKYRYAVAQAPDERFYKHQLGVVLTGAGRPEEGFEVFAQLVNRAEAHYNVGYLLKKQGHLLEAEEQFQRALALQPEMPQAQSMLAQVRQERGVGAPVVMAANAASSSGEVTAGHVTPQGAPVAPVQQAGAVAGPQTPPSTTWQPTGTPIAPPTVQSVAAPPASHIAQPPPGLTPQQLEQWRNQQTH